MRTKRALLLLALFLTGAPAGADVRDLGPELSDVWVNAYDEEMNRTIDSAREAEAEGDWRKAAALYQDAADRATNEVHRVGRRTYLGIREYVKSRIRSWPAEGLATYRGIVDPRVEEIRRAALARAHTKGLREIAVRYPLSTAGARTMLDLGTRALARGDVETALRHLLEILRIYPEGPIPEVRRADVVARAAVAAAKRGDRELLAEMAARASRLEAGTTVRVAGAPQPLAEMIDGLETIRAGSRTPPGWATVGGSPARSGGRDGPDGKLVPYFTVPIAASQPLLEEDEEDPKKLAFPVHPLLTEDSLIIPGQLLVTAYPLPRPGAIPPAPPERSWAMPPWDPAEGNAPNSAAPEPPVFATRSKDLLSLAFPDPSLAPEDVSSAYGVERATVVTASLSDEGKLFDCRGGVVDPRYGDRFTGYVFCGAPVIVGDRLWISGTRSGNRVETWAFCFDLSAGPGILRPLWQTAVSLGNREGDEGVEASSVSLRNGIVYLCSNTGAVAALAGESGEILWVHKYERSRRIPGVYPRESKKLETWAPNPPVLDHRYLYVTPLDSDSLFIYFQLPDIETGYVAHDRFSRQNVDLGFEPRYMLGARDGVVFLAGETRKQGERPLFAVKAGPAWFASEGRAGDPQRILWRAAIEEDLPRGRGVLAGDAIYFPTAKAIYRVAVADGAVTRLYEEPGREAGTRERVRPRIGNLAVAGPWLVSATECQVTLFGPPPGQKEERETGD